MKRFLKIFSITLASLVLVVLIASTALIYWTLNYPQSVWNLASGSLLPNDLKVTWDSVDFDWHKNSWKEWNFSWSTKNLVVTKVSPKLDMGIVSAEAKWAFNFWNEKPTFEFARFVLQTRENSFFHLAPSAESSPEKSIYQTLQEALGYLSQSNKAAAINTISVNVADFQLHIPPSEVWSLKGTLFKNHVDNIAKNEEIHFDAAISSEILQATIGGVLNGSVLGTAEPFSQVETNIKADAWSVNGKWNGVFNQEQLSIQGHPKITIGKNAKPLTLQPDLQLIISEKSLDIKTQVAVAGIPGPIVSLEKVKAEAHIPIENNVLWVSEPATVQVHSPVDLFLIDKNMRAPLEKACHCKLPEEFQVGIAGRVWLKNYFDESKDRKKIADAKLKLQSVKNKLFSADVAAAVDVLRENNGWLFEPQLDASVMIYSFQGLRQFLDAKGLLIPAPLDILEGTISLTAKSPIKSLENKLHTAAHIAVDLKSPSQQVNADAEVILELANTFNSLDVDIDAVIKTLKLDLPPLDPVLGIPAISADSRILRQDPKKEKSKFKVNVVSRLRTEKAGAIQLSSKYAKPFVPISLHVNAHGTTSSGYVRLEPFSINYLRRKIYVEKVEVGLAKNEDEDLPLVGRLRIEQGGYKIFIALSGTVQAPDILLSSDPFLSKNDIISVLLYGRVADKLVSNEAETTGNVNAAMTDKAVGLLGLWAFASTPIQSFSYNATTKVYTATVDLGKGVTAGVGTNWEQATNFELRKRVSQRWMLTATWAPNQANRQEGRLVLQWEKRF